MIGKITNLLFKNRGVEKETEVAVHAPAAVQTIVPPRTIQPVAEPTPIPQPGPRHDGEPVPYYPRKGPAVPAIPPRKILGTQDALIRELRQASALSFDEFDTFMLPAIMRFAEFVHLLPASEYDHHSDLGGLFRHGLEVALNASRRSEGKEFALNEVPSIRKFQIFRWRACALLGGMLHDLGKAVIDVGASDVSGQRIWNPHVQPLWAWMQEHKIDHYTITWREQRRHREHDAISATALLRILPDETMRWLGEYRGRLAYDAMLMALTGSTDRNNPLIEIIKGADGDSVAMDRAESHKRMASIGEAGSRSNAAQVVRAMRELILQGKWQVNELGNLVWHTDHGLYMLWPHCAKEAIEHLRAQAITITNEPPLVLTMLREAGILAPNVLPNGESYDLHRLLLHVKDRNGSELSLDVTAVKFTNDRVIPDVYQLPNEVRAQPCDPDGKPLKSDAAPAEVPPSAPASAAATPTAPPVVAAPATPPATSAQRRKPEAPAGKASGSKAAAGTAPVKTPPAKPAPVLPPSMSSPSPADTHLNPFGHDEETMLRFMNEVPIRDREGVPGDDFDQPFPPEAETTVDEQDGVPALRDWGKEKDFRDSVIEENLAVGRNPFPPTTADGAEKWMELNPRSVYLGYIVDQAKDGVLQWQRDIFLRDDLLHIRYPLALEGCGTDPVEVLDIFKNEDWIKPDTVRASRKVVALHLGAGQEILVIRFNHGITQLLTLLFPPQPTTRAQSNNARGPYIQGWRADLLDANPPPSAIGLAILRSAFYDHLADHYEDVEGGMKHATQGDLVKQMASFLSRHSIPSVATYVHLAAGDTPLIRNVTKYKTFELVPTYDRGFDETLIHRALQGKEGS